MTKFSWTGAAGSTKVLHSPFLILDLGLDIVDGVRGLNLEGDGLAREGLYENLHFCARTTMVSTALR